MENFLVTWNSSPTEWPHYTKDAANIKTRKNQFFLGWKIGHSKHIHLGDRLFVFKQGSEPRGLIGIGHATSGWYAQTPGSSSQPERSRNVIDLKLEWLLDFEVDEILTLEELTGQGFTDVPWNTRSSGVRIPDDTGDRLYVAWERFLAGEIVGGPKAPEDDVAAVEGQSDYRYRKHRRRDRYKRKEKIDAVLKRTGRLMCEVPRCHFDFVEKYGPIAKRFAHVHHLKPLGNNESVAKTKLKDLAIVCANCHAMIHFGRKCRNMNEIVLKTYEP
jgi:hypothetical protein